MEHAKVVLIWSRPGADIELVSTTDHQVLMATKQSLLRLAQYRLAAAIGDESQETTARYELEGLKALLNAAVPEKSDKTG